MDELYPFLCCVYFYTFRFTHCSLQNPWDGSGRGETYELLRQIGSTGRKSCRAVWHSHIETQNAGLNKDQEDILCI